jgi:hypothetical protein
MRPLLILILSTQLVTAFLAARQQWLLRETRRLLDTANAQLELSIVKAHADHPVKMRFDPAPPLTIRPSVETAP